MKKLLEMPWLLPAILALGLFAMSARNATDPDLWWHLRTGQLTMLKHAVFHDDPFSFTRFHQPWINHEWFSDVFMFEVLRLSGWGGLITAFAAMIAASFLLVYARCPGRPYLASLFTAWAALAAAPLCAVRPGMFSLLLASLLLLIVERGRESPLLLWWIPLLMVLWVNVHAGYLVGIAILALLLAGEALDTAFGITAATEAKRRMKRLGLVLVTSLAVVPVNPYGFKMYSYPLQTLHSRAMQAHIAEWFSPDFHQPQYMAALLLLLAGIVLIALSPRRLRFGEALLLAATLYGALSSVRNLPFFAVVAAPIFSGLAQAWLSAIRRDLFVPSTTTPAKLAANLVLLAVVAGFSIYRVRSVIAQQPAAEAAIFPQAAVSFLSLHHLPQPLFNHYDWGGYLIWRLYPGYRVFIDGRADLYGDSFMDAFADTYSLRRKWEDPVRSWGIHTALLPREAPLLSGLEQEGWREVYRDSLAVIVVQPAADKPTRGNEPPP